jgi:hypothetical protein
VVGDAVLPSPQRNALALHELLKPTLNSGQELRADPEKHEAIPAKTSVTSQ